MRTKNDFSYSDYKEDISDRMLYLKDPDFEPWNISSWAISECDMTIGPLLETSEALLYMAIGEYEIKHDILEERIREKLMILVPKFESGYFDKDLYKKEKEMLMSDCKFIRQSIEIN